MDRISRRFLRCVLGCIPAQLVLAFCLIQTAIADPRLEVNPNPIVFGGLDIGASMDKVAEITNTSDVVIQIDDLRIVSGNDRDVKIISPAVRPFTINPHQVEQVILRFSPKGIGDRTTKLDILSSDGEMFVDINGHGNGTEVSFRVQPNNVNFGKISPFETKDTIIYLISEGTDPAILVGSEIVNSGSESFTFKTLDPTITFPVKIAGGDSIAFKVTFHGDADPNAGLKFASMGFSGEVKGQTGALISGEVVYPTLAIDPTDINFKTVEVGRQWDTTYTITNTSEAGFTIDYFDPLDPAGNFSFFGLPSFPYFLDAGKSLTIGVRLNALLGAPSDAVARFFAKIPSSAWLHDVQLHVTVLPPAVVIDPIADIEYECARETPIVIGSTAHNVSTTDVKIVGISTNVAGVTVQSLVGLPTTLPGSQDLEFDLTLDPAMLGSTPQTVTITMTGSEGNVLARQSFRITPKSVTGEWAVDRLADRSFVVYPKSSLGGYGLHSLHLKIASDSDIAVASVGSLKLNTSVASDGMISADYDATGALVVDITSANGFSFAQSVSASDWLLSFTAREFVSYDSLYTFAVEAAAPGKEECLSFTASKSSTYALQQSCGDQAIRDAIAKSKLILATSVYPNPAVALSTLNVWVAQDATLELSIASMTGATVSEQKFSAVQGENLVPLYLKELPAGTYFLRVSAGSQSAHDIVTVPLVITR